METTHICLVMAPLSTYIVIHSHTLFYTFYTRPKTDVLHMLGTFVSQNFPGNVQSIGDRSKPTSLGHPDRAHPRLDHFVRT